MSNKVYDVLKWIAQILLPAAATLYFALSNVWGLPYAEQIVGTITAVDAFLGVLLGVSSATYKKAEVATVVIEKPVEEPIEKTEE